MAYLMSDHTFFRDIYECLLVTPNVWVKAGTLGSKVTARINSGEVFNKPIIHDALHRMSKMVESGDKQFPGFEFTPTLGARVNRLQAFVSQDAPLVKKGVGVVAFPSEKMFVRNGKIWINGDGHVTVLQFPDCQHDFVERTQSGLQCVLCLVSFNESLSVSSLFHNHK